MKGTGASGNRGKGRICFAVICILTGLLSGCGPNFGESHPQYVDYVMEHKEEAERFLEKEFGEVSISYREEEAELCVTAGSGVTYSYHHSDYADYFKYITAQVESDENEPGILTIDVDDSYNWDKVAFVMVSYGDYFSVGLKYKLPDFDEVIDNWGDVGEKRLKLEEWVTSSQMKAYYDEGRQIEVYLSKFAETEKQKVNNTY